MDLPIISNRQERIMKLAKIMHFVLAVTVSVLSCGRQKPAMDYSDESELEALRYTATKLLDLDIEKIEKIGSERNFVAVKSQNVLFSRRLDSRTYFVQDDRYGNLGKAGVFNGPDKELLEFGREVMKRLEIPLSEIGSEDVLQENIQLAHIDSVSGEFKIEDPEPGKKLASFSRIIDDIPVFSSGLTLGLTKDKKIGFMELHWPRIPEQIITEAHRLKYKVAHGWKPPEREDAKVESVEAGIIHSAAPGFLMDIYPVIRVIYMPADERTGRKLTLHFDRDGNTVPFPRIADMPCPEVEAGRRK